MRVVSLGLCFIPSWPPFMRNIDCQVAPSLSDRVDPTWWQCVQCSIQVGGWWRVNEGDPILTPMFLSWVLNPEEPAKPTNLQGGLANLKPHQLTIFKTSCDVLCRSYVFFFPPQLVKLKTHQPPTPTTVPEKFPGWSRCPTTSPCTRCAWRPSSGTSAVAPCVLPTDAWWPGWWRRCPSWRTATRSRNGNARRRRGCGTSRGRNTSAGPRRCRQVGHLGNLGGL